MVLVPLTGCNHDRPGLREALAACREGDTLVVTKLDRLARPVVVQRARDGCRVRGRPHPPRTELAISLAVPGTANPTYDIPMACRCPAGSPRIRDIASIGRQLPAHLRSGFNLWDSVVVADR
jgi:hypothetical protein